jgi:hypothetical protein
MNSSQIVAFLLLPLGLALACSDEGPEAPPGQGGNSSSGAAGTNSTAAGAGSGGSSSGSAGASGSPSSAGNVGGTNGMPSGTGGNGSSSGTPEDVCERGCVKTESLNCPNDPADCEAACLANYLDFPAECRALVLALGECAADRPASDFVCDEEGEAILRAGICGAESVAVASCLLGAL